MANTSSAVRSVVWCANAAARAATYSGKPWRYVPIAHDVIWDNVTIARSASQYQDA
jgi:hypothetical protein